MPFSFTQSLSPSSTSPRRQALVTKWCCWQKVFSFEDKIQRRDVKKANELLQDRLTHESKWRNALPSEQMWTHSWDFVTPRPSCPRWGWKNEWYLGSKRSMHAWQQAEDVYEFCDSGTFLKYWPNSKAALMTSLVLISGNELSLALEVKHNKEKEESCILYLLNKRHYQRHWILMTCLQQSQSISLNHLLRNPPGYLSCPHSKTRLPDAKLGDFHLPSGSVWSFANFNQTLFLNSTHFRPTILMKVNSENSNISQLIHNWIYFSLMYFVYKDAGWAAAVNQDSSFCITKVGHLQMSRLYKVIADRNHVQTPWGRFPYTHPVSGESPWHPLSRAQAHGQSHLARGDWDIQSSCVKVGWCAGLIAGGFTCIPQTQRVLLLLFCFSFLW